MGTILDVIFVLAQDDPGGTLSEVNFPIFPCLYGQFNKSSFCLMSEAREPGKTRGKKNVTMIS